MLTALLGMAGTLLAMACVAGVGVILIRGIWLGQAPRARFVLVPLAFVAAMLLVSWPTVSRGEPTRVAAAVTTPGACLERAPTGVVAIGARGDRVSLTGAEHVTDACAVWAVLEDPRTGALWLQGPGADQGGRWHIDLVVGLGHAAEALDYRVSLFAVTAEASADLAAIAALGAPLALAAMPAAHTWLAQGLMLTAPGD